MMQLDSARKEALRSLLRTTSDHMKCEVKEYLSGSPTCAKAIVDVMKGRQGSRVVLTVGRDEAQPECTLMVGAHVRVQDLKFQVVPVLLLHSFSRLIAFPIARIQHDGRDRRGDGG
eukprot:761533-Hanusia_phi.AAC.1